jgi:lipoprotein-anchoring transpeptidase ErfK/SrfK
VAVRRWIWFVAVPVMVVAGFIGFRLATADDEIAAADVDYLKPALEAALPSDAGKAQAALAKARADLARLAPDKKYIVIDTNANLIYLRTQDQVLFRAVCSTGSGGELVDSTSNRKWVFNTPRGVFKVNSKLVDPWWRKPDWAFIEDEEAIPKDESERYDPEMLGAFAMGFGNGYFIHGTIYERLLGVSVTHGCVRVGDEDLHKLYGMVTIGTPVYVF